MSETAKYRLLTTQYLKGNGVDLGSQGDPVVPWAIQVDLPADDYARYSGGETLDQAGIWRGTALDLPFRDNMLDFVYSSHLIEDFPDWAIPLREWSRVLKPGGYLVILTPEAGLWEKAIFSGQPPNCAHQHCGKVGEISSTLGAIHRYKVIEDRLTDLYPGDYSILFIGKKV